MDDLKWGIRKNQSSIDLKPSHCFFMNTVSGVLQTILIVLVNNTFNLENG